MPLPRFAKLAPEKRHTILDAALEEFAERGFEGSSFNRIVAHAGVSKGAIYYYFADKEDLYLTVLEQAFAGMAEVGMPPPAHGVEAYWEGISRLYGEVIEITRRDDRVVRLLQHAAADLGAVVRSPRLAPWMDALQAHTERLLRDGQRVGGVRRDLDLELLASLTFAVGEVLDRHMMASGELRNAAGAEAARARGMDTLRRLLQP